MSSDIQRRLTYRIRQTIGPGLDAIVRQFADISERVRPEAYTATVECPIDELESRLSGYGFMWNPLSMYHYTALGNQSNGSWVLRASLLSDRQLHVILIKQGEDAIDVYAHEEYNWFRHPIKHAQEVDLDRKSGAEEARRHLDAMDLEYHQESIVRRKAVHLGRRCRNRLAEAEFV